MGSRGWLQRRCCPCGVNRPLEPGGEGSQCLRSGLAVHESYASKQGPQLSDQHLCGEGFQDVRVRPCGEQPFHSSLTILSAHRRHGSQCSLADRSAEPFIPLIAW